MGKKKGLDRFLFLLIFLPSVSFAATVQGTIHESKTDKPIENALHTKKAIP